ncbi:sugar phosphate isomerase/epimerase family protein [Aquiflexum gelatinilyticum]|uniref:Sugar phosphate isomerase/epimerase n=1 Tax=Aquiflexum gelatinilyticum TaxID=2961943 RepID=A0A9X2PAI4_9BACT|nr:sugar phosphate isomerase/epimerase [Aquiflexum gelatinilyticum]MCR9016815.1 sugar phosphate isomerase/epimerase [Aquiflexum gelatinilyticum]
MKFTDNHFRSFSSDRRDFIQKTGLAALAVVFPLPSFSMNFEGVSMGIVVHSYGARWNSKVPSEKYPGFENALQLIEHCGQIGAGGVQVGVNNWTSDFSKKVREQREKLGMYLEGSIGLPKSQEEIDKFEKEVLAAKEAGATILRTVCLGGRRYETFKTETEFLDFKAKSILSLQLAEPIVSRHKMKLAVENHKDWRATELVEIIKGLDSESIGVTLDFGNNYSLLEKSEDVIALLAPYSFSTHIKDMGVQKYEKGFLLSEVPLGEGIVDLKRGIELCRKYNPNITFNLEMITRDPLEIPVLEESYFATFKNKPRKDLKEILQMVDRKSFKGNLPTIQGLDPEKRLAFEESNVLASLRYSRSKLGLGK